MIDLLKVRAMPPRRPNARITSESAHLLAYWLKATTDHNQEEEEAEVADRRCQVGTRTA